MALMQLPKIAWRLIEAGRRDEEPVAIVSCASTPEQRIIETTLEACVNDTHEVKSPAIIAVGPVVQLRSTLDWFGVGENL
jgi:uroporphyrin-III C-methyltransferase